MAVCDNQDTLPCNGIGGIGFADEPGFACAAQAAPGSSVVWRHFASPRYAAAVITRISVWFAPWIERHSHGRPA
jgi:hypothetical protein